MKHQEEGERPFPALPVHIQRVIQSPQSITPAEARQLQHTIGNRALGRLPHIQAKLTVGPVGDQYEQEADRVASQVVQAIHSPTVHTAQRQEEEEELQMKPISTLQRQEDEEELQMKPSFILQRQEEEEEEVQMKPVSALQRQEEEEELQMKPASTLQRQEEEELQMKSSVVGAQGGELAGDLEQTIQGARGSGQPLSGAVRGPMEQAFGADFSGVRVHTGGQSDALNRSIQARAFTTGQDIFFRSGEYNPGNQTGQELLAHELTHTIQQGKSVQRTAVQRLTIKERMAMLAGHGLTDPTVQKAAIVKRIKDNYGVDLDQSAGVNAIKKSYKKAPKSVRDGLKPKDWTLQELQDVETALSRYGALLGSNRDKSLGDQSVTTFSRLEKGIDVNSSSGELDTTTAGETFTGSKNISMFDAGTTVSDFVKDKSNPTKEEYRKGFRGTIEHELSHALIEDLKTGKENKEIYKLYQGATRFWTGWSTPRAGGTSNAKRVQKAKQWNEDHKDEIAAGTAKKIEPPITNYGAKTASEDLAEALMFYFEEPGTLKTNCPERYSFIETVIKPLLEKKKKK
ncbi:MAG: DUF4157 domain-containing protein [Ardenticatenaceae bacterium]|nr:DUF4157 domain-containing protein [Ardenticatenaceae bacterium]MCB8991638.1 DUF4157 domain-containing protein [Ardenticatenaceae bacterium]MCB9002735.1 DUF4157 domain-containing protein [Ardenticatenaceae bacterium]